MGHRKSSFFSMFNIFKSCCSHGCDYMSDDSGYRRRICPSDEDRRYWVAEPGIDRKATDFIARFYASQVMDPERQTIAV